MRASGAKAWGFESSTPEVTQKCVDQSWRHVLLPIPQGSPNRLSGSCRGRHRDSREPHLGTPPLNPVYVYTTYVLMYNINI